MANFYTYDLCSDAVFILNNKEVITYANNAFCENFPDVGKDINKLIPYFDFDICILDNSQIFEITPISLAIKSKENYSCSALHTKTGVIYEIFTYNEKSNKIFILKAQKEDITQFDKKIKKLESENQKAQQLKQKAQTQAAKIGLLNRIYTIIQKENELDSILFQAYQELNKVFGAEKLFFAKSNDNKFEINVIFPDKYNYAKNCIFEYRNNNKVYEAVNQIRDFEFLEVSKNSNGNFIRITIPVYDRKNILGVFSTIDEDFLNSLCSQLSAAVSQAILSQQLKENQLQLINSEKLATLGNMIAAVAHEINTPLASINSNNEILSKLVEKKLNFEEINDNTINLINTSLNCDKEAIKRIMSIVSALKKFVRLDEAKMQLTDVSKELDVTLDLCQHLIKNRIVVVKDYKKIPQIYTHPNMLNQVLMNLITNAAQSILHKGKIVISTYEKDEYVIISIKDNGCGIKEENKSKIFQQGYTTKTKDNGTGLGLSISKKIMEQLGGKISFNSKENEGSEFFVQLPLEGKYD